METYFKKDIFRDTNVRFLGYANEVGEAFRKIVPVKYVKLSYIIASTYCLADATHKSALTKKRCEESLSKTMYKETIVTFTEALVWQGLASVIIPGFTINRICWISAKLLKMKFSAKLSKNTQNVLTTSIGLTSIPLIIKPIDR